MLTDYGAFQLFSTATIVMILNPSGTAKKQILRTLTQTRARASHAVWCWCAATTATVNDFTQCHNSWLLAHQQRDSSTLSLQYRIRNLAGAAAAATNLLYSISRAMWERFRFCLFLIFNTHKPNAYARNKSMQLRNWFHFLTLTHQHTCDVFSFY